MVKKEDMYLEALPKSVTGLSKIGGRVGGRDASSHREGGCIEAEGEAVADRMLSGGAVCDECLDATVARGAASRHRLIPR